jgi:hypothetical protein
MSDTVDIILRADKARGTLLKVGRGILSETEGVRDMRNRVSLRLLVAYLDHAVPVGFNESFTILPLLLDPRSVVINLPTK